MLKRYFRVVNISDRPQIIHDRRLAGGFLELQPDEEVSIQTEVYLARRRECRLWLRDAEGLAVKAGAEKAARKLAKEAKEAAKAAKEAALAVEAGVETPTEG